MTVFNKLVDTLLELKPAGAVAVDTAHPIVDIGAGLVRADMIIRHSALDIVDPTAQYELVLCGSNSATFASGVVCLASLRMGKGSAINTALGAIPGAIISVDDPATGANAVPFTNEHSGVIYRYVRLVTACTGTITTGINFYAHITKEGAGDSD